MVGDRHPRQQLPPRRRERLLRRRPRPVRVRQRRPGRVAGGRDPCRGRSAPPAVSLGLRRPGGGPAPRPASAPHWEGLLVMRFRSWGQAAWVLAVAAALTVAG